METWNLLLQVILLLLACFAAGSVMALFRQSPLVGFLLAGMFMGGPGSLAIVKADTAIEGIAELGVALLLFSLGLEFSWSRVMALGRTTLLCGALQVILTMLAVTLCARFLGLGWNSAIAVSAMVSLSSTATVLGVFNDRAMLDSAIGRQSLAVLLVQDMAVVPLALLVPLLGSSGESGSMLPRIGGIAVAGTLVVLSLYFVLNTIAVRIMRVASISRNRDLMVILSVVVGLGATWAAHAAKLSPALGAFLAGMFLGNSPFAFQIRADVASLRVVLLTLFFGAVGMVADPVWMFHNMGAVFAIATGLIVIKAAVVIALFMTFRNPTGTAVGTGLCLAQVGEFAFVLGGEARSSALLTADQYSAIVSASIVTLLVTPTLIVQTPKIAAWLNQRRSKNRGPDETKNNHHLCHYLLVGFGPAGRGAAEALQEHADEVMVLDLSSEGLVKAKEYGFQTLQADATSAEILAHLHPENFRMVVITIPGFSEAMTILKSVRQLAPKASIVVRSRYRIHQQAFETAGADIVIGDEEEVGTALGRAIRQVR
ncbi:MAG: cation:proton antiporter [Planctomycetaceae bacterium]|nr:cation:proton antiporter [Planctomycetaceae bacterium]